MSLFSIHDAIEADGKKETPEEAYVNGHEIGPIKVRRTTYAEPSTAIVPVSQHGLLAQAEIISLEARIQTIHIAEAEAKNNAELLGKSKVKDQEAHGVDVGAAIQAYRQEHKKIQRAVLYFKRGWKKYKPDTSIDVSERTGLLESVVQMQATIAEGYQMFSEFPKTVKKISNNYGKLKAKEIELGQRLGELETLMQELPLDIQNGENQLRKLKDYALLDAREKAGLIIELRVYSPTEAVPRLEIAEGRKIVVEWVESAIAKKQLEAMQYGTSKILAAQELSSVKEQRAMIEEQMEEINKTWLPALSRLELLKQTYDMITGFEPAAMAALGMNKLREKSVPLIADAKAAIQRAKKAVAQSRLNAEAAEEAEPEIQEIYAPAACAPEETVEVLIDSESKKLEAGR